MKWTKINCGFATRSFEGIVFRGMIFGVGYDIAGAFGFGELVANAHQVLISPIPIFLRMRSGYFCRAFSASFLVLNAFDKMTSSRPWYSNSSHRAVVFIRSVKPSLALVIHLSFPAPHLRSIPLTVACARRRSKLDLLVNSAANFLPGCHDSVVLAFALPQRSRS